MVEKEQLSYRFSAFLAAKAMGSTFGKVPFQLEVEEAFQ